MKKMMKYSFFKELSLRRMLFLALVFGFLINNSEGGCCGGGKSKGKSNGKTSKKGKHGEGNLDEKGKKGNDNDRDTEDDKKKEGTIIINSKDDFKNELRKIYEVWENLKVNLDNIDENTLKDLYNIYNVMAKENFLTNKACLVMQLFRLALQQARITDLIIKNKPTKLLPGIGYIYECGVFTKSYSSDDKGLPFFNMGNDDKNDGTIYFNKEKFGNLRNMDISNLFKKGCEKIKKSYENLYNLIGATDTRGPKESIIETFKAFLNSEIIKNKENINTDKIAEYDKKNDELEYAFYLGWAITYEVLKNLSNIEHLKKLFFSDNGKKVILYRAYNVSIENINENGEIINENYIIHENNVKKLNEYTKNNLLQKSNIYDSTSLYSPCFDCQDSPSNYSGHLFVYTKMDVPIYFCFQNYITSTKNECQLRMDSEQEVLALIKYPKNAEIIGYQLKMERGDKDFSCQYKIKEYRKDLLEKVNKINKIL